MIIIDLAKIYAAAPSRKPGYLEAVMAAAKDVSDTHVTLEAKDFNRLRRDYGTQPQPAPPLTRTDAPSFLQKVKNFAVASAKHAAAGMPMASDEEIIRRHDICLGCEFLKNGACSKCGCPVVRTKQYVSKLSWADSECPVGKWGKESRSEDSKK